MLGYDAVQCYSSVSVFRRNRLPLSSGQMSPSLTVQQAENFGICLPPLQILETDVHKMLYMNVYYLIVI